jgi:hypothetical protein
MEAGAAQLATPAEINASLAHSAAVAQPGHRAASIKEVAGLLGLVAGLIVLGCVAAVAMIVTPESARDIAVGAFGVIGSIVAAYFGVKVGADGAQRGIEAQRQEAAKAQVFAAHVPTDDTDAVLKLARDAAAAVTVRR